MAVVFHNFSEYSRVLISTLSSQRNTEGHGEKREFNIGPIVQYDSALPRLLAMSIRSNDPTIPALHRVASYESLDADMSNLARSERGVRYVSYFKMLCPQNSCLEYAGNGIPLQSDYGHLTGVGSVLVATKLLESGALN